MYSYEVLKAHPLSHDPYGILAKTDQYGDWVPVAVAAPFSSDFEAVSRLAETCTALQLSPEHLIDVVSDFISQAAMNM